MTPRRAPQPKRLAGGFTIRFFETKAKDLAKRLLEYSALVPASAPEAKCAVGDARDLSQITPESLDLIVSSPPYPGVYDYFDHHELRLRWLGMDETAFEENEIGARRRLSGIGFQAAVEAWENEFGACLDAFRDALAPQGSIALVIADSVLGGRALYADEAVRDLAIAHGLVLACLGSQERPYFHEPTRAAFRRALAASTCSSCGTPVVNPFGTDETSKSPGLGDEPVPARSTRTTRSIGTPGGRRRSRARPRKTSRFC